MGIVAGLDGCKTVSLSMQGATMGQMGGVIKLTNGANAPCTLQGYPVVRLVDQSGVVIPAPESRGGRLQPRPLTWPRILVRPGGSAWINVTSSNWCGPPRTGAVHVLRPGGCCLPEVV